MPLLAFKQNLRDIVQHPTVVAQKPRLILITPPPINEYQTEARDQLKGYTVPSRSAEHTKKYADATREVGTELEVPVLDIWSIIMEIAGWKEGEPLIGSKKLKRSEVLESFLIDGKRAVPSVPIHLLAEIVLGLHFLPAAYEVLFESMMKLIARQWPDQDPRNLTSVSPNWTVAPK